MGMSLGHGHSFILECTFCNRSVSRHKPTCPMLAYEEAQRRLLCYVCPVCRERGVDVNDSDYFECRSCHRQFSRNAHHEGEGSRLFLDTWDDFLAVVELPEHGRGIFPAWIAFEEACRRIELLEAQAESVATESPKS